MGLTSSQGIGPFPREMAFPVPKGTSWHDLYDYIRYNWLIQELHIHLTTNAFIATINTFKFKLLLESRHSKCFP